MGMMQSSNCVKSLKKRRPAALESSCATTNAFNHKITNAIKKNCCWATVINLNLEGQLYENESE